MAANLTTIAINARKSIKYGLAGIIAILILRSLFGFAVNVYRQVFPKKIAPNVKFGALTSIPFPPKTGLPEFEYSLELPTGSFPALPEIAKVFYIPKDDVSLQSSEMAKGRAGQLGFNTEPISKDGTIYKFSHPKISATLEMNIVSGIFNISYNLAADPIPLEKQPPDPNQAASIVKTFLNKAQILPEDLNGNLSQEYLRVDSQGLSTALSLSEANLIKINLFRSPIDEIDPVTADPNTSNVWFILSGESEGQRQIIAAEFHHFNVDDQQVGTYPLIKASEAMETLKAGKGYIASLGQNQDGKVIIRRIYLGYYDPGLYTSYYQPVIVFEGDRGFKAYVPAVTAQYYGAEVK